MPTSAQQSVAMSQYLSFRLGEEEYAVPILRVKEIIQYTPVTRVPGMPPAVLGVINLRGKVVTVVSPALKFGLPPRPITRWTCIVIAEAELEGERADVGLLVDSVSQVMDLTSEDMEPAPSFGTRVRAEYLQGLGRTEGGFVLLLELGKLLSPEELLAAAQPEGAPEAAEPPRVEAGGAG